MDYYHIYKKYIEPKDKKFRKILFDKLRTNKVDSNVRRFLWNPLWGLLYQDGLKLFSYIDKYGIKRHTTLSDKIEYWFWYLSYKNKTKKDWFGC